MPLCKFTIYRHSHILAVDLEELSVGNDQFYARTTKLGQQLQVDELNCYAGLY